MQMIAGGELRDLQEARAVIRESFPITKVQPGRPERA
jgi:hypothetical protein